MTPEQSTRADAYAGIPSDVQRYLLDDLAVYARDVADPLVRAGRTDAVLFLLLRFSEKRRAARRTPPKGKA